jgi:hypothetical protein
VFTRSTHRPAVACVLACAFLVSAMTGAAAARPTQDTSASAAPAQDLRSPDVRDAAPTSSLAGTTSANDAGAPAQESYYSSYGEPAPLTASQPPVASDDSPWLPIALSIGAALAIAAASATRLRRLRIRRRRAARVAT